MGHARRRPLRLAEKLLQIRTALGLSQTEMHRRLDVGEEIPYTRISDYELDKSEPTLMILLSYARLAGVPTEVLIDDGLDLPDKLPGPADHEAIKRKFSARRKRP
ncbi:MAG TPA: helix-turn-helix transcriptional regulator [Pyrinomonadaceae bacterium]|jgi:transcriptional regulator with XRE-family HTH domain